MQELPQEILLNEIYPKLSAADRKKIAQTDRNFRVLDRKYLKQNIGEFADLSEKELRNILKDLTGKEVIHFCNSNSSLRSRCEKDHQLWAMLLERDFPMWNAILKKMKLPLINYRTVLQSPILSAETTQEIFLELLNIPARTWQLGNVTKKEIEIKIPNAADWYLFTNIRNKFSNYLEQYRSEGGIMMNITK